MAITNKVNFRWVRKTDSTLGTDTPGDPQIGTSPLNKVLEQLIDNDVDLDSRIGGSLVAHTDTTGIQGTGPEEIHLNSVEKSEYDGLNPRVTSLENSGGGGGSGPSFLNQQVFTFNGSLTIPANINKIKITATGGGGGGVTNGIGGGGGGTAIGIYNVIPGEVIAWTIGIGGSSNASNPGTDGTSTMVSISGHLGSLVGMLGGGGAPGDGGIPYSNMAGLVPNSFIAIRGGNASGSSDTEGGDTFYGVGAGSTSTNGATFGGGGSSVSSGSGANGIVVIEYNQPIVIPDTSGFKQLVMTTSGNYTLPTGIPIRFIGIGGGGSDSGNGGPTQLTADSITYSAGGGASGTGVVGAGVGGAAGIGGFVGGTGYGAGGGSAGGYGAGGDGASFVGGGGGASGAGGPGGAIYGSGGGQQEDGGIGYGSAGGSLGANGGGGGGGSFNVIITLTSATVSALIGLGGGSGYQGIIIADW